MLAQNRGLVEIVQQLHGRKPNIDEAVPRLLKSFELNRNNHDGHMVASRLSEIIVNIELEHICRDYSCNAEFDPIKNKEETNNYYFELKDGDNLKVFKKEGRKKIPYVEIDGLFIIDYLPTIIEVKLVRKRFPRRNISGNACSSCAVPYQIEHAMSEERIRRVTDPIKEVLNSKECGYVLITWDDTVKLEFPMKEKFLQSNGILGSLYGSSKIFRRDVRQVIKDYQLPVWH